MFLNGQLFNYSENDEIQACKLNYNSKSESIPDIVILPKEMHIYFFFYNFLMKKNMKK